MASDVTFSTTGGSSRQERSSKVMDGSGNTMIKCRILVGE